MLFFQKIKKFFLDTLFPIRCLSCQKEGCWICDKCFRKIALKKDQFCPICEKKTTPSGFTCFKCRKKFNIDGILVSLSYQNKLVSKAVHLFKYRFIEDLSNSLGKAMLSAILSSELPIPDIIIPVPLHQRRLRWRGFNQADLLAQFISPKITPGFPILFESNCLVRQRYTFPQMKIKNYSARQKNIQNAFKVPGGKANQIKNKRILLVDDVATTGSTLFECAKTLKKSGAREVFAVVVARQEMKA